MEQSDSYKTGSGGWLKEGERINQGTYTNDPWTWVMVWGLPMVVEGRMGWGEQRGKIGTTVIAQTIT